MHYFSLHVLLLLATTTVQAQTTTRLPPAPAYRDGVFTSPNTFNTQILDKGSEMNITWTTSYKTVNLFVIFGQDYVNSRALRIATTDTFFLWTVDDLGNNSLPFSFRAVNSAGTAQEQAGGGFYTGQFWIRDRSETSSVAVQAAVVTTTEDVSSSMIATTTTAQLSSSATQSSASTTAITINPSARSTSSSSASSVTSSSAGLPSTTSPVSESAGSSSELSAPRTNTPVHPLVQYLV
ncbi:hypothetical protein E4T49_03527 [Aureobasidium sp. EXF-10728]|nr:hypothetical protein E4T49_03527 [Aureobasidium sp. EXF-10728]